MTTNWVYGKTLYVQLKKSTQALKFLQIMIGEGCNFFFASLLSHVTCHLPCLAFFLSYISQDCVYVEVSGGYGQEAYRLGWGAQTKHIQHTYGHRNWIGLGANSVQKLQEKNWYDKIKRTVRRQNNFIDKIFQHIQ